MIALEMLQRTAPSFVLTYFAKVEFGVLLRADTFELKERRVWASVTLPPLVSKDAALAVKTMYPSRQVHFS